MPGRCAKAPIGALAQDPRAGVTRHDVRVIDGEVQVRLAGESSRQ
jgi:hypothetical protein